MTKATTFVTNKCEKTNKFNGLYRFNAFKAKMQHELKANNPTLHSKALRKELSRIWSIKSEEEKEASAVR
jgi:hypothetical protein